MINLLEAFKNEDGFTKKKFGQHFLTNHAFLEKIITSADITSDDCVIEIGPGCGVLTQLIAETGADAVAFEIDDSLIEFLNRYLFFYKNLKILKQDASVADYNNIFNGRPVIIIGNLPYNLSVKIFEKAGSRDLIKCMVFMFQKEVADRITAKPCSKAYSSLSVYSSYMYDIVKIKDIGGGNFWPNANVMSTVLKFIPKNNKSFSGEEEKLFFSFLRNCFRLKRKTLKNNLHDINNIEQYIQLAGLNTSVRAEEMNLEDFERLFRIIYDK